MIENFFPTHPLLFLYKKRSPHEQLTCTKNVGKPAQKSGCAADMGPTSGPQNGGSVCMGLVLSALQLVCMLEQACPPLCGGRWTVPRQRSLPSCLFLLLMTAGRPCCHRCCLPCQLRGCPFWLPLSVWCCAAPPVQPVLASLRFWMAISRLLAQRLGFLALSDPLWTSQGVLRASSHFSLTTFCPRSTTMHASMACWGTPTCWSECSPTCLCYAAWMVATVHHPVLAASH